MCGLWRAGASKRPIFSVLAAAPIPPLAPGRRPPTPVPPLPRAARRSIRLLCGSVVQLRQSAARCVVLTVCRSRGRDRRGARGRGGLHFEAIEIATMEVKMLKEKELSNIGWTSAADIHTDMLVSYPAACDST